MSYKKSNQIIQKKFLLLYTLSFVSTRDVKYLRSIQKFTKTKIINLKVPSKEDVELKKSKKVIEEHKIILDNDNKNKNINKALIEQLKNQGYSNTDISSALIEMVKNNKICK